MDYTAENLEKVVTLFYRSEAGQQAQAHQWLTEAQNSPQAWSFVWELLQPHRSSEVQFFAATTLHTKLLKHWNEVPTDHYEQLKKKIVENIINYAMGPKIVLNRLCIALSAYIIHTIPNHWPNAFEELVSSFQPQNLPNIISERVVWILLEILTVIPEEFQSTNLPNTQKLRVRTVLQEVSRDILKVIEMCLMPAMNEEWSTANLTTYLNSARCASAWLQFGGVCVSDCAALGTALIRLVCKAYWSATTDPTIGDEGLSGDELELVEAATEALGAIMSHPYTHKYPGIVTQTMQDMLQHLLKICDTEHAKPPREQNKDILCAVYGLLVTTADTHCKLILERLIGEDEGLAMNTLGAILQCSAAPGRYPVDETASALAFGFWYTLQDGALALEGAAGARALLALRPVYRDLVAALLRKAAFPSDVELARLSADDRELFRCYRQDVADTLLYCHGVLGAELLALLHSQLAVALVRCRENAVLYWPHVESCLHAYYAIAEAVDYEDVYLARLMLQLRDIPYSELHTRVRATALDTFGAYTEWITEHPELLGDVVPFLTAGLAEPAVVPSASMALKDLATNCQRFLQPFAPHILHACQAALHTGNLRLAECVRLMFSVGKVLSVLPVPNIMDYLQAILGPHLTELQALVSAQQEPGPGTITAIVTRLKLVSAALGALHVEAEVLGPGVEQPTLMVARSSITLWRAMAERHPSGEVMEALCTLLRHVTSVLPEPDASVDVDPLVAELLALLAASYRAVPQACVLHVARLLFVLWGRDMSPSAAPAHALLVDLSGVTLALCAAAPAPHALAPHADVLEAFFHALAQLIKKSPRLLLAPGLDAAALFQCGSMCVTMSELSVLKAAVAFLVGFVGTSRELGLAAVVTAGGEQLVARLLLSLGGTAPRSAVEPVADLLLALNRKFCDSLARWLPACLATPTFPSPRASPQQKEFFIRAVLREKANKRKLTESVLEFTLICRGIIRPEVNHS